MSSKKILALMTVILIIGLTATACQPAPTAESPAAEHGTGETAVASTTEETSGEIANAPVIRYSILADLTSTNVWNLYDSAGSSYWNYAVQGWQWPALYVVSDVRWDYIPSIADGFPSEVTQEGDFYVATVTLKEGPVWSDGTPVTANDVVFTVTTAMLFGLGQNWNAAYNPDYLDHVEAVDPLTLRYYFSQMPGLPVWQYGALTGPIVNQAYWEPRIADLVAQFQALDPNAEDFVDASGVLITNLEALPGGPLEGEPTSGGFRLSGWEVGAYAETTMDPLYFFRGSLIEEYANGAYREVGAEGSYEFVAYGEPSGEITMSYTNGPHFDTALYTLYDSDTSVLALRNNDVDFLLNPSGLAIGYVQQLRDDPNVTITENLQNGFRYMGFNQNREYLSGEAGMVLRQAIACMLDLDFLSTNVLQGQVAPVYTMVPPGLTSWYNEDVPIFCQGMSTQERLVEAVRMLSEAGYSWEVEPVWNENRGGSVDYGEGLIMPNGQLFPAITLLAPNAGYDPLRATTGVYIEQWMRQLGIPVTAELTNFNNILTAVYTSGDYDIFILGWGLTPFPGYLCDFFYNGVGADNPYGYESPTLQEQCSAFFTEPDLAAAQVIADELQMTIATELPYITLFTNPIYDAFRNLEYPYTQTFDGLGPGIYGAPLLAWSLAQ